MRILAIDAWSDCCGCDHTDDGDERCWTWNNWHTVGQIEAVPENPVRWLITEGFLKPTAIDKVEIDDDQFNIVVVDAKTREPLYAFEYGAEQ